MKIEEVQERTPELTGQLLEVWEASVKATHLFLSDGEIERIKAYVPQALHAVEDLVIAAGDTGRPAAFMGAEAGSLEMLFLAPEARGQGAGKTPAPIRDRTFCGRAGDSKRAEPAGQRLLRAHGVLRVQADAP